MSSLITNRSIPLKISGRVYESCVRSVMLYSAETWALTGKLEDILKSCDSRMLRYMVRVRWQDRISSEEVAKRCCLKMIQYNFSTQEVAMVWSCEKVNGGRNVEISGGNGSIGEKESRKTM